VGSKGEYEIVLGCYGVEGSFLYVIHPCGPLRRQVERWWDYGICFERSLNWKGASRSAQSEQVWRARICTY
jgi:hypothetical protein